MRNVFYVLGSIASLIVTITLGFFLLLICLLVFSPGFRTAYYAAPSQVREQGQAGYTIYPPSSSANRRVVATAVAANKASIESLTQLNSAGASLGLVYSTSAIDVEQRYGGFYFDRSAIVDQRESSRECKKLDEDDAPGPDSCRIYPNFFQYRSNDDFPTSRSRSAFNAIEFDAAGEEHILFKDPVRISHVEILWGHSADYAVFAYVNEDSDKDGTLTQHDNCKIAVLNLKTLAFRSISLPGSFLEMESVIGRNDTFKLIVGVDLDKNGRFDPVVEPMHVVSVNFATGEVKPAISDETMAVLQKQIDDAAARRTQ